MAKKQAKKQETIKGDAEGKTTVEQAKAARDEKEPKGNENAGVAEAKQANAARTDKEKASDAKFEARADYLESKGISANQVEGQGSGAWKTGDKVAGHKMYSGDLTLKGVSQSGHEISCRVRAETPKTEEELFYIFSKHHDSAVRDGFVIDAKNKEDSMLQTPFG